jgi:hypothetical protein
MLYLLLCFSYNNLNRISGVMVSMLPSSAIDRGFEPWLGQTKDYKIGLCCFSAKHAALKRKSKDWLARNQNNVSEWSDMSSRRLLFQWASTIKVQLSVLVYNKADLIIISLIINLFSPWYCWIGVKQQTLTHFITIPVKHKNKKKNTNIRKYKFTYVVSNLHLETLHWWCNG